MKTTIFSLTLLSTVALSSWAQSEEANQPAPPPPSDNRPAQTDSGNTDGNQRNNRGQRGNFNPEEFRTRMMNSLREQLGVTKDDEWAIISERITAVTDLRRNAFATGGMMGMRSGSNQARRLGAQANPEADALQEAIKNNAPDAEIKARLEKFRQARKDNEAKLAKAQEDLRTVLSVRQEAIAVSFGLLP